VLGRTLRLLSLPAGALVLAAEGRIRTLAGADRERVRTELRARNTERTRRVLGELKGGALKAGQLLSTVEALFPSDPSASWRETLTGLQQDNPALPFSDIEPVLVQELGPRWPSLFSSFDPVAAAAASIGQVHRAIWADGRPVAVKVQYPGMREALESDVRAVSVLSRAAALVARGLALPPLVAELRERLLEELDYLHEAAAQRRFALAYDADPRFVVPAVVHATPRVLVQQWLDGTPLARVAELGSQAERDRAAELYQLFLVSGPERAGLLHTDPHPGNFRITADGRLGVLDFGSTLRLPDGMPPTFGRLIAALLSGDEAAVLIRLREDGFLDLGRTLEVGKLIDYMAPFSEPARHERFTFSRDWLRGEFGRVKDPRNPDFGVALQLRMPSEHLFTHRVWLGMVGVLCQLEATVPVRAVLDRWLPGFSAAAGLG